MREVRDGSWEKSFEARNSARNKEERGKITLTETQGEL